MSSDFPAPIPASGSLDFAIPATPMPMQMPGAASSSSGMGPNAIVPTKRSSSTAGARPQAGALEAPADSSSSAMDIGSSTGSSADASSSAAGSSSASSASSAATRSSSSSSGSTMGAASSTGSSAVSSSARPSSSSSSAVAAVSSSMMSSSGMDSSSSTGASEPVVYSESALLFTPADPLIAATYNVNVNWYAATNNRSQFDFVLCKAPGFQPKYASQIHLISAPTPYNPAALNKYVLICAPYNPSVGACVFQSGPDGCVRGTVYGNFSYDASALSARVEITSNPPASSVFKLNLA